MVRIALLEDESDQADLMQAWLTEAGYNCAHFDRGRELLRSLQRDTFDLAILDWGLPDMDGIEVLEHLREQTGWTMPVLFVTARESEQDSVAALQAGADDYMTKPVRKGETLARINALLRRAQGGAGEAAIQKQEPFEIDPRRRRIQRDGVEIELTEREFDLALFLFRNVDRLVSRGYLLETVWGTTPDLNTRTIDTHISRLRAKLGLSPENGWRLKSVYHHGYRLERVSTAGSGQS